MEPKSNIWSRCQNWLYNAALFYWKTRREWSVEQDQSWNQIWASFAAALLCESANNANATALQGNGRYPALRSAMWWVCASGRMKKCKWLKTLFTGCGLVIDAGRNNISLTLREVIRPERKCVSSFWWLLSVQNNFTTSLKHTHTSLQATVRQMPKHVQGKSMNSLLRICSLYET